MQLAGYFRNTHVLHTHMHTHMHTHALHIHVHLRIAYMHVAHTCTHVLHTHTELLKQAADPKDFRGPTGCDIGEGSRPGGNEQLSLPVFISLLLLRRDCKVKLSCHKETHSIRATGSGKSMVQRKQFKAATVAK